MPYTKRWMNSVVLFIFLLTCFLLFHGVGCVPNVARTNARVEDGFDFALSAGAQILLPGENEQGNETGAKAWPFPVPEFDFQFGKVRANSSAFAVQLKVPMGLYTSTLDLYYQLAPAGSWYYGFGAEFGYPFAGYICVSHYFTSTTYLTFTPRLLSHVFENSKNFPRFMLNPQISFGWAGDFDTSLFLSYGYAFGDGMDICILCDGGDDLRKQFILTGVALRF